MLRRSVRSLEQLLEQQQPVMLLLQRTVAPAAKQAAWKLPPARTMTSSSAASAMRFTRPSTRPLSSPSSSISSPFRAQPRRAFHSSRTRRSQEGPKTGSTAGSGEAGAKSGSSSSSSSAPAEPLSLSARLKKLSREYGWTAVGVYFGLSLLDFPFCFLLVRTLGTDRIAAAEEFVISHVKTIIPTSVKEYWHKYRAALKETKRESGEEAVQGEDEEGWGVKEAEERNNHEASLATQLALAYAIHKSFIFVRVPLTAAVTPKVVKVLRSWGWKIGKQKPA